MNVAALFALFPAWWVFAGKNVSQPADVTQDPRAASILLLSFCSILLNNGCERQH